MLGVTILRNVKYLCFCSLYSDPNHLNPHHVIITIPKLTIHRNRPVKNNAAESVGVTGAARHSAGNRRCCCC